MSQPKTHYAWAAAFAFVGMCAAIAYAIVNTQPSPPRPDPQVECIKQRGKWAGSGWGPGLGTCEFPVTTHAGK